MKKPIRYLIGLLLPLLCYSCSSDGDSQALPNDYIEITQQGAKTFVLKGYLSYSSAMTLLVPEGYGGESISVSSFGLRGRSFLFHTAAEKRLDAMSTPPVESQSWQEVMPISKGMACWIRGVKGTSYGYIKLRVAYIEGNDVGVEYFTTDITSEIPNTNSHAYGLEVPALNQANLLVQHQVEFSGRTHTNMTLEWIPSLRHANWVAFTFDTYTSQDHVSRTDAWAWDPLIPSSQGGVEESHHKSDGFDKGHLCASEDRVYCKEANEQTFYYSNISPQLNEFNSGFWMFLEKRVRTWGRSTISGAFDKVYVVKGGSMNQLLKNFSGKNKGMDGMTPTTDANGLTPKGLACPAYYFMAILAEHSGSYQAIGFWVEHGSDLPKEPTADQLKSKACSIDELEKLTNLDLFCNLPDGVEERVEASCNLTDWAW